MTSHFIKSTIIILRSKDRAQYLKKILLSKGYKVIIEPIISIYSYDYVPIDFTKVDAIMFTSVNSVKILKSNVNKKAIKNIKTYCVGDITEKWAKKSGFNCVRTGAYSGATLEKAIIKNSENFKKEIIIFGGEKIAHNPIPAFKKAGIDCRRIILYKTIPIKNLSDSCKGSLINKNVSHIIFYSPYIAEVFDKMTKEYSLKDVTAVCLGKNTNRILKKNKWKKVLTINNVKPKSFANSIMGG